MAFYGFAKHFCLCHFTARTSLFLPGVSLQFAPNKDVAYSWVGAWPGETLAHSTSHNLHQCPLPPNHLKEAKSPSVRSKELDTPQGKSLD